MTPTIGPWRSFAAMLAISTGLATFAPQQAKPSTRLGIRGAQFTINDQPAFLVGISYYGALGAAEDFVRRDLADMKRFGINWIRVWATWAAFEHDVSAVDAEGRPRQPFLDKLKSLLADCDGRGIIVDVTLSRGNGIVGPPRLQTLESHKRAVETLLTALRRYPNWYLDVANERDVRDKRYVSVAELKALRKLAQQIDSSRLVTASHGGDLRREDMQDDLQTIGLDFICPHRPRNAGSPRQTEAKTRAYLQWMKEMDRIVPLHYQEPFVRGYTRWQPRAEEFLTDVQGAKSAGAAGWCLHNGSQRGQAEGRPRRSFDLRDQRLFDQLDEEEQKVLAGLRKLFAAKAEP